MEKSVLIRFTKLVTSLLTSFCVLFIMTCPLTARETLHEETSNRPFTNFTTSMVQNTYKVDGRQDLRLVLETGALNFVAHTANGFACNQFGDWRNDIGFLPHKVLHFVGGALREGITSRGNLRAMLTGGGAAAVSESIAEMLLSNPAMLREELYRESLARGRPLFGRALEYSPGWGLED